MIQLVLLLYRDLAERDLRFYKDFKHIILGEGRYSAISKLIGMINVNIHLISSSNNQGTLYE
jgi:hypothetical protein